MDENMPPIDWKLYADWLNISSLECKFGASMDFQDDHLIDGKPIDEVQLNFSGFGELKKMPEWPPQVKNVKVESGDPFFVNSMLWYGSGTTFTEGSYSEYRRFYENINGENKVVERHYSGYVKGGAYPPDQIAMQLMIVCYVKDGVLGLGITLPHPILVDYDSGQEGEFGLYSGFFIPLPTQVGPLSFRGNALGISEIIATIELRPLTFTALRYYDEGSLYPVKGAQFQIKASDGSLISEKTNGYGEINLPFEEDSSETYTLLHITETADSDMLAAADAIRLA